MNIIISHIIQSGLNTTIKDFCGIFTQVSRPSVCGIVMKYAHENHYHYHIIGLLMSSITYTV